MRCAIDLHLFDKQTRDELETTKKDDDGVEHLDKKKKVSLKLPDDYICEMPIKTRNKKAEKCSCRWCELARLNGLKFKRWQ